jgi:beta-galactosidase GanA
MAETFFSKFHRVVGILVGGVLIALSGWGYSADVDMKGGLMPELRKSGAVTQLYVEGKPFLALGGELGNSTASDLDVLEGALARCEGMHLNTVMLPVYWDRIEPAEGKFDFSLVRGAIERARGHHLHLVYLWFGTWKNSMSCYVPGWVKRDTGRFERARQSSGEVMEIIRPESDAAREADIKAFSALMRWTKEFDAKQQTVIMVQVENEIGMIPEARDHSAEAETAYHSAVPKDLMSKVVQGELGPEVAALWDRAGRKSDGTWGDIFGSDAQGEEIFTAWEFSTYVEKVAAAGKREYALPMYVNAALIRPGYTPGKYPSGGPLPHLMEVWRLRAPSVDMLCPDIYFPNFGQWCGRYVRGGNPVFIPEMTPSARACGNAVFAAAQFGAMGFGPFGIEGVNAERERQITECYRLLAGMSSLVLDGQRAGKIVGLSPDVDFDWKVSETPARGELGGIIFEGQFDRPAIEGGGQTTVLPTLGSGRWEAPAGTPLGSAMILQVGDGEFVILGMGVVVTFSPADGKGKVGIDEVQEGKFDEQGNWVGGRWLNGDETHQGRHVHLYDGNWSVQRVKLYRY